MLWVLSWFLSSFLNFSVGLVENISSRTNGQSNKLQLCVVSTCRDSADSNEDNVVLLTLTKPISRGVVLKQSGKEAVFKFLLLLLLVDHYNPMSWPKLDKIKRHYWLGLPTLPQAQWVVNRPSHNSKPYNAMIFFSQPIYHWRETFEWATFYRGKHASNGIYLSNTKCSCTN